ncbi:MAG: tetratricopeptide repeat protein [Bacteroides sp.]|nr:tetratricopeptide repeat protein [Bacteroides sp.]
MMKRNILFALILLVGTTAMQAQDSQLPDSVTTVAADDTYTQFTAPENYTKQVGDSAYLQNDYALAINIYETLLQQGEAPEVYYNLGNCYYKTDEIAKAILNYERALLLSPNNADFKANLEIARAKTIDKIVSVPEIFFVAWTKGLINCLDTNTWAYLGVVFFIVLLVACALYFLAKQATLKKTGFIIGAIMLLFTILCNIFAAQQKDRLLNRNEAIVMNPSVTVRSTPSESGTSLFILHEGTKVIIKDSSMKEWTEITLEDGKVGWLPATSIEII